MAVTLNSQPQAYCPVYNVQEWVATSNQTGSANFSYRLIITDVLSGATATRDVPADLAGYLKYDTSTFAKQYMTQLNPCGLYGFNVNTGAVRKITVNIGEVYGSTPTYYAGTTYNYYVWNGALDLLDYQAYNYTDYVYDRNGSQRVKYLTSSPNSAFSYGNPSAKFIQDETTISSRSSYIYALCAVPGTTNNFQKIEIRGYDANGSLLATTEITNPNAASTNYYDQYSFIDVGYKGLLNMPGAQITAGSNPIPVSTFAYYDVFDTNSGVGVPAQTVFIKRFYVGCEAKFDIQAIHYLSKKGEFETQLCTKSSLMKTQATKVMYSKLPYTLTGSPGAKVMSYNYDFSIDNVLSSTQKNSIVVNTDWLEEYQMEALRDLISSPKVLVDFGSSRGAVAMNVINSSMDIRKKFNDKLFQQSFELEYTHINVRQEA